MLQFQSYQVTTFAILYDTKLFRCALVSLKILPHHIKKYLSTTCITGSIDVIGLVGDSPTCVINTSRVGSYTSAPICSHVARYLNKWKIGQFHLVLSGFIFQNKIGGKNFRGLYEDLQHFWNMAIW